ncbi:hypothetical protein J4Q44_G00093360 [Coregonus suidteri]|uniref:Uncharacterized protein n=1 Tax=Coregonus suidteri TaxID=861788 RepID=A0AAN8M215_9TELE
MPYFPLPLTPVVFRRQVNVCRENTFDKVESGFNFITTTPTRQRMPSLEELCRCPTVRTWRSSLVLREMTWSQTVPGAASSTTAVWRTARGWSGYLPQLNL